MGALYIFEDNDVLSYKKTLYHDFGHVNTINYCEDTDSLIFGNGSGQYGTDGEMYIVEGVKHWKEFSKETMIELDNLPNGSRLVKFEFGRYFGDKVNVYWGENNLGQHNICYVASNGAANFSRLLLGKGNNQFSEGSFNSGLSEGEFNGTYEILKEWSTDSLEVIQGARYYNGYHYLGLGHHGLWLEKYKLHEDGSVASEGKREMAYKEDGSTYDFYASECVDIREGMIYHSTFGNSGTKAIHKYRVF